MTPLRFLHERSSWPSSSKPIPLMSLLLSVRGGQEELPRRAQHLTSAHPHLSTCDLCHPRRRLAIIYFNRTLWRFPPAPEALIWSPGAPANRRHLLPTSGLNLCFYANTPLKMTASPGPAHSRMLDNRRSSEPRSGHLVPSRERPDIVRDWRPALLISVS
jgi:hypothetical protein